MVCEVKKIDSNDTGLSIAEEECIGQLPVAPVFYAMSPNSYEDFGGEVTTTARNPINRSRQRKKGKVVDLDASGGFNFDLTDFELTRLMQGFCFADAREKAAFHPLNGPQRVAGAVVSADKEYGVDAGGASFVAGRLVLASGYGVDTNNGVKTVASSTATDVTVVESLADEATPPAAANLAVIGHQFASGDVAISMVGGLPALNATAADFTTMGLIAGEWIFIGGDTLATQFANSKGFARISSLAAKQLIFDKVSWATPGADVGTGKTIRIFFGTLIRNENDPDLIKRRSYVVERTLGRDADGTQSEHLKGAVPSELTINWNQAEIVTVDMSFVAIDHITRTGSEGLLAGTRVASPADADAFNSSSDLKRLKLATISASSAAVTPLFAFATEATLAINNNLSANKALANLGAIDVSAGNFDVDGTATVYFADVLATRAVRDNADVTLDIVMVVNNAGVLLDVPLLTLGDGRANVEQDQPITLPLEQMAAESKFGNTLTYIRFPYLPDLAS